MSGGRSWQWDRRGKVALGVFALFQVGYSVALKAQNMILTARMNREIAEAESAGGKLGAMGLGILRSAGGIEPWVWTWLIGTALLAVVVIWYRPRWVAC